MKLFFTNKQSKAAATTTTTILCLIVLGFDGSFAASDIVETSNRQLRTRGNIGRDDTMIGSYRETINRNRGSTLTTTTTTTDLEVEGGEETMPTNNNSTTDNSATTATMMVETPNCINYAVEVNTDFKPMDTWFEVVHRDSLESVWVEDGFKEENSMEIRTNCLSRGNSSISSGNNNNTVANDDMACFIFTFYDRSGNGNCCAAGFGHFKIVEENVDVAIVAGLFRKSVSIEIGPDC